MVKCDETSTTVSSGLGPKRHPAPVEDVIVPEPEVRGRKSRNGSTGSLIGVDYRYVFRLQDAGSVCGRESTTSASVYSIYKQRIDSMFDDSRSQMSCKKTTSSTVTDGGGRVYHHEGESERRQRINNSVQVRIEKMFVEMAKSNASTKVNIAPPVKIASNRFRVDYLGSVPLSEKVTSLQGLQEPLMELYLRFHRSGKSGSREGTLEISGNGLKVSFGECGDREHLNPFSSIAVWAAVKFVHQYRRRRIDNDDDDCQEFAFLPLIADPEAVDKGALFRRLSYADRKLLRCVGVDNDDCPLFVVVMRKSGTTRQQLECHGFLCVKPEDAIIIAASLYQALIVHMKNKNAGHVRTSSTPCPTNKNGVGYMSLTASASAGGGESTVAGSHAEKPARNSEIDKIVVDESVVDHKVIAPPPVPVRPPRRKNRSSASSASEDERIVEKQMITAPLRMTSSKVPGKSPEMSWRIRHNRSESEPCAGSSSVVNLDGGIANNGVQGGVRRVASDLHGYSSADRASGDILTKVAIPRSRSFLNAGGPLTRYSRRQTTGPGNTAGTGSNGSPLGFNELFAEFRAQEGLNSLDDILDAIIDSEGMSFNDLKPIYKEFLLKLAVTLTKDELYQRSKNIMRRQRKKMNKRNNGTSCAKRKRKNRNGFQWVFRRSVSKLRATKTRPSSFEFTSILFPSSVPVRTKNGLSLESTLTSTSSYSIRNFQPLRHPGVKVGISKAFRLPRRLSSRKPRYSTEMEGVEEFRRRSEKTATTVTMHNRSSSGYFTCSECSYDSESCTCTSADKCYCSMGERKKIKNKNNERKEKEEEEVANMSSCCYDTDSCVDDDKCYCSPIDSRHHHHHGRKEKNVDGHTVFSQLKQRGFAVSESSLSRAASPATAWKRNETKLTTTNHNFSEASAKELSLIGTVKSYKSLEFLRMEPSPNRAWNNRRTRSDESGRFHKRMDVYEPIAVDGVPTYHLPSDFKQRRSYSSDNLVVDYDLFTTSSRSEGEEEEEEEEETPSSQQRKVLVVSARDPRGRIIYMGASCRSGDRTRTVLQTVSSSGSSTSRYGSRRRRHRHNMKSSACEALSVKKSAEIAALFSEMKLSHATTAASVVPSDVANTATANSSSEVIYNTLEPPDYFFTSKTSGTYLGSNLENSLGYLP